MCNEKEVEKIEIPRGFMLKADGSFVPKSLVSDIDKSRSNLVQDLIKRAKKVQQPMVEFKRNVMDEISAFIDESAKNYDAKMGGKKGNVTLISFDGRFKVTRNIADIIVFDERIQVAKALTDECIKDWQKGSNAKIKVLVQGAFQVDKQGNLSVSKVLNLKTYDIKDPVWLRAMQAISDATKIVGTKPYIRFYERIGDDEEYTPISLDVAAL